MADDAAGPAPKIPRIRRTMLADEVYESLKAMLMDNAFPPDSRLTTDFLAQELGVSRTPVRESLARLETEGLLVKRPMAGYSVTPPLDRRALGELYTVRLALEPMATRLAAVYATDEQLAALAPTEPRAAPQDRSRYADYRSFVAHDAQFHDGVAAAAGNELLRRSIQRLHSHLHTYRLWSHGTDQPIEALREHAKIAEALRARDSEAAEAAMRAHLEGALARLNTAFE
ncbi:MULTISPECIES: GntR family transcriptional regulator [unclassified Crossiella]|uniref:GntR family transcriptional regulator n=1 Tax=unclassified Crossiella TaxID=2620835 RepID=UPI001FFECD56|nr:MULTISPECIES: GntR family transcriptional regulator [unclassified Crossiella]MCK2243642.1 GntR family transcriptional regulator [Crossiella sp. S99.2]MCK2257500.1 GntR family transcriptional regulator [Crossiella sp. S99.1]